MANSATAKASSTGSPAAAQSALTARRAVLRRRLLKWYERAARDLPWRRSRDAYRVWVSEIMLQQTQVATVRDYFTRFMAAFPTLQALADAPEEQVLRQWEGLGYYRRARQMHQAARMIVLEHGGVFPDDPAAVRALPGIGRYTAGAILSIAFDRPEPILEANTVRLLSRLLGYRGNPRRAAGQRLLWETAAALVPRTGAGRFNQALMELGSRVCTPREPKCPECPLLAMCRAARLGLQNKIPKAAPRPAITAVQEAALLVSRGRRVLLIKREGTGRWAGLWDFPRFAADGEQQRLSAERLSTQLRELTGIDAAVGERIATFKHGVTRYRITLDVLAARYLRQAKRPGKAELRWFSADELEALPLNTTGRKLARLMSERTP